MAEQTFLDEWSQQCKAFFADATAGVHPIHPCIINGRTHYVHAPHLATEDPQYYARLSQFAERHDIGLKPDQRKPGSTQHAGRRKKFVQVIFLAMGFFSAGLQAEQVDQHLGLMAINTSAIEYSEPVSTPLGGVIGKLEQSVVSQALKQILLAHLDQDASQPSSMQQDIEELSLYYAQYPAAVQLLQSIAATEWTLRYAPHTFQTNISGSRLEIDRIDVFFDPRSGARLKFYDKCKTQKPFCIASPADALLHELLHVQTVTQDTSNFIRQGGLDPMSYPAEHERLTIQKENQLYAAMTAVDGNARPIRNEHNGRHVLVSCATCLE
ncbi:MAG: hypothetical protein B0W54_20575 [Cellvibrio sp. 79]|nr:MAG: hypothetical protein B0W54_20575 [Cellvibrio sp. 79]